MGLIPPGEQPWSGSEGVLRSCDLGLESPDDRCKKQVRIEVR